MGHLSRGSTFSGPAGVLAAAVTLWTGSAAAQEAPECRSPDPADWPAPAKPYFMLVVDTSGSMTACTNPATAYPRKCPGTATPNTCGMEPTRMNDAKCALRQTVQAFAGEVNFGLSTYGTGISGCPAGACVNTCNVDPTFCALSGVPAADCCPSDFYGCTFNTFPAPHANNASCGNLPGCSTGPGYPSPPNYAENSWLNGGNIVVGMLQDPWWLGPPPPASNVPELLSWFDGLCGDNRELYAGGWTPIAGSLRSVTQYLRAGWSLWNGNNYCPSTPYTFPTPMDAQDRACRSVNVILVTDGNPSNCEAGNDQTLAENAAADLFNNGVSLGGKTWPVQVHVINFAGGTQANTDAIANAGGTGASLFADDEATLSIALSSIVSGAISPEVCNNTDDNCNGCTDEGSRVFCNRGKTPSSNPTQPGQCCSWSNQTQRDNCIAAWQSTVNAGNPTGDQWELPCWTPGSEPAGFTTEESWLCANPGEVCDNADNNCDATCEASSPYDCGFDPSPPTPNAIDEGFTKCGSPLACPTAETCDGQDEDCDGIVDNAPGSGVPFSLPGCNPCVPSTEICDGCDNDCDGIADNGIADIPCGFSQGPPCNDVCAGTRSCGAPGAVSEPGACLPGFPGSRFGSCSATGGTETCNGCDDDCDGIADNGIPPTACDAPGDPGTWVYGAPSQCRRGMQPCNGPCTGWVGPGTEVCDGIDNDCDGVIDNNVPGTGNDCGTAVGQCQKGTTACVGGVIVCQGGNPPQPEICNGLDDDCDGTTDDAPLGDAPSNPACWDLPASGCSPVCNHANLDWCPPPGGTCTGTGSLSSPCTTGTLICDGANGWKCQGGVVPAPEVCDGADNDCNSQTDENLGSPVGDSCGSDVGECMSGTNICDMGSIVCDGEVGPTAEQCNGLDDDCNGLVDDGIPLGSSCEAPYDTNLYPGDRTQGECRPGNLDCDGNGGLICVGGVGPSPEVCDGIDNDCDGQVDEAGPAPDGIDGTADPLDPTQSIGDPCGTDVGECSEGALGCVNGAVVCLGGVGPQPESCDCADNDCDGVIDNENDADAGLPALCSPGKTCVDTGSACFCAEECGSGEFPCPTGTECESVVRSGTQTSAGDFCIPLDPCGDCPTETVMGAGGAVECAPAGTAGPFVPVCECKGQFGCHSPCFNIDCPDGQDCVEVGPSTGQCQDSSNCYFFGCQPGEACDDGNCVDDPCDPNPCAADEVCKPNEVFDAECVGSCADVSCSAGQKCVGGACEDTGCGVDCTGADVCKPDGDGGFACGPSECTGADGGTVCANGAYCDPATGACGNDPCTGVACPAGQECQDGECVTAMGTGGAGGAGGGAGTGATGGSTGGTGGGGQQDASAGNGGGGNAPTKESRGVFGLATGGGGCACATVGSERTPARAFFACGLLMVAVAAAGARRRRRDARRRAD